MKIALVLFDGITALDVVGPYEVLSRVPGAEVVFAGPRAGLARTDNRALGLQVDVALADVHHADVLLVPGGYGVDALIADPQILADLRRLDAKTRFTTSVCTGALVLGAAGLLQGLEATTHWAYLEALARYGATPVSQRVVWQGRVVTAAGVSAGIDMALALAAQLAGDDVARGIQLAIEYDPEPPFHDGHPRSAAPELVERVRSANAARRAARTAQNQACR
ncbi:MAG: DJ-1/PfpI family protein [Sandaracinaceae bacterium]|jgi:putative intracellular protease/amidase|nr:DJ-1/PfpI family protein [Sandaracinaceae bacterium]MBK6810821.1 DJ-1/PfpI family protein [Sandaracinaceae bacterium]MBK7775578.1 DJ-1/PfpI family protein [Sandaracinaceae bacterium]MBK8406445.1 DJ-1/PfpI family protein [Sandaracinaceae bacterium]MBP7681876.1 DJ-1/PfpI family protein [Deltaproteobacteria bacterium]